MGFEYTVTAKVVTDQVLFTPTGAFGRWASSVERGFQQHGVREAPLNRRQNKTRGQPPVGTLKAGIRAEMTHVILRRFDITLTSNAFYSQWVHEGTSTIYSRGRSGQFGPAVGGMRLPPNTGYGNARWRQRVRGQKANPFLKRAYNATAMRHSSLGRFPTF